MAELTKKLNVKKSGAAAQEIKLYSTLDEVNGKGVNLKSDGINCYAAYGDASDSKASQLNYKPSGSSESYKVLTEAPSTSSGDGITVTLKARRNNEDFMQDLPPVKLEPGQKFYLNNANAPTIEGYDFVCCSINNFIPVEDTEINVYYIPQTVPDRTKTWWGSYGKDATGDLSLQDYANTYAATNMQLFFNNAPITGVPRLNTSNVTEMISVFYQCKSLTSLDLSSWDTANVNRMVRMFSYCTSLITLDLSNWDTANVRYTSQMFDGSSSLTTVTGVIDMSSCTECLYMFTGCPNLRGVHLRNVPKSLDMSKIGGTEGTTYIIDNYLD